MDAVLIRSQGFALEAEIEVSGQRLCVMDSFSQPESPRSPGPLRGCRLTALERDGWSWEEAFSGNRNKEKRLEALDGWSYVGYGQIVAISPTIVDVGVARLEVGPVTHDERCIGEYVQVQIDRLEMTTETDEG